MSNLKAPKAVIIAMMKNLDTMDKALLAEFMVIQGIRAIRDTDLAPIHRKNVFGDIKNELDRAR